MRPGPKARSRHPTTNPAQPRIIGAGLHTTDGDHSAQLPRGADNPRYVNLYPYYRAAMRWSHGRVDSDGESIYYEVSGAGPTTIVLGHGAGGSHASWFQQVPALAGAGYRVVTWDTRGFGCSTFRSGVLDVAASVRDLSAVLEATSCERAVVVGQSMGGWWACGFALAHPERVSALVLANTVGGVWTPALETHFGGLASAPPDANPSAGDTDADVDGGPLLGVHPAIGASLRRRDLPLAFLYQQLNTFHEPPMGAVLQSLTRDRFTHADVAALSVAKLWITSSDDPLFPAALVRDSATQVGAQYELIDDAGHSPYFERAAQWNATLLSFLAPLAP